MNQYRKNKKNPPDIRRDSLPGVKGAFHKVLTVLPKLCLTSALVITAVAAVTLTTGDWAARSALAGSRGSNQKNFKENALPPVTLSVTGPVKAKVGEPLEGVTVRLLNTGKALRDSRLRLYAHVGQGHELGTDDIKIEVKEGNAWKPVPVEPIDEGVMGAIGVAGEGHKERHESGGFSIGNKASMAWSVRVTFNVPGNYTVVMSVSPDNGSTQLAQPISVNMEAS